MSSIQELREKRTAKAREYRNLLDRHPESIPEEAANQFDALETEISALDDAIARHEKVGVRHADQHDPSAILELGDTGPDALHELSGFGGGELFSPRFVRDPVGDAFQFAVDESSGLPGYLVHVEVHEPRIRLPAHSSPPGT